MKQIVETGSFSTLGIAYRVTVKNNVTDDNGNFHTLVITDPNSPSSVGSYSGLTSPTSFKIDGDFVYSKRQWPLKIINMTKRKSGYRQWYL